MNRIYDDNKILKAIFFESTLGIILTNAAGDIIKLNEAAARLFAYDIDELLGQKIEILIPESSVKYHDKYREGYHRNPTKRLMGAGRDLYGKRKDGSLMPVEISLTTINIDGERLALAYIYDIAVRLQMAEAVAESEARLDAVINHVIDGILTIDQSGTVLTINPAGAKIFGYQQEEVIGKNVKMLMPEPDHSQHDQYLENYQTSGVRKIIGSGREVTGLKKSGTRFPLHLSISEVPVHGAVIYSGLLRDLTEHKMAEEKMRRYAQALERSNQELQDFAYVSSHDLQEPLRKIRAFGDRLKVKVEDRLNEKELDYLNRMLNGAERMQNLIDALLAFSRVSTKGKAFEKINLNDVLERVVSDLEILIEKTGAKIVVKDLPVVEADPTQMWQLFQNLINNAIKFRKENEPAIVKVYSRKIQREAHLSGTPGDVSYDIFVEDNGIGFDEKYLDKIFQIFQRLEGRKYKGSGIGLAICKRIANRHGGDLTAKSKPGKGATFIITLAAKQPKETD